MQTNVIIKYYFTLTRTANIYKLVNIKMDRLEDNRNSRLLNMELKFAQSLW